MYSILHIRTPLCVIHIQINKFYKTRHYIGPLPPTNREHRYIWIAIDYLTKWPEARSAFVGNAPTTARFICEDIICRHGCPDGSSRTMVPISQTRKLLEPYASTALSNTLLPYPTLER